MGISKFVPLYHCLLGVTNAKNLGTLPRRAPRVSKSTQLRTYYNSEMCQLRGVSPRQHYENVERNFDNDQRSRRTIIETINSIMNMNCHYYRANCINMNMNCHHYKSNCIIVEFFIISHMDLVSKINVYILIY